MALKKNLALKVACLSDKARVPTKGSEEAACFDIYVADDIYLPPHATKKVGMGVAFDIPSGYRLDVYLRSSVAANTNVRLANSVAKIDSDYTGELLLLLHNTGGTPVRFYNGERIAQCELNQVLPVELTQVDEITKQTNRGAGGVGSTGK